MAKIIFPQENGGVSVLHPSPEWDGNLDGLAKKDIPPFLNGNARPYLIVEDSEIPQEREHRNAWEADFSSPDGYGSGTR